ncbi:MAG: hypothetical protein LQ340_001883 [Diploschistes diacapsis]|nr:MAG: hypothetical protein LQ340_001883 [Diploschistes diacapsis]
MTLLVIPTTLFAILVLTSVLASVTRQPIHLLPALSTQLLGRSPEWVSVQLEDRVEPQLIQVSFSKGPIRLQLRWRSDTMKATQDPPPRHSEMPPPPLPPRLQDPAPEQVNVRNMKRFSLQLRLQGNDNVKDILTSSTLASPVLSTLSAEQIPPKSTASEANDFLTALAAQERRVLELKEELEKAELDLTKLKKQWAVHEATKKRNEIRHVEPLRPLKSPKKDCFTVPAQANASQTITGEDNGRRAISIRTRQPQRTVFEGGRHTRTLSLLSPTSLENHSSDPRPTRSTWESRNGAVPKTAIPRVSTNPPAMTHNSRGTKDDLVYTGKQFVGDLKDGFWTFFEDIRQATVGDEALTAARSRQIGTALEGPTARNGSKSKEHKTPNRTAAQPCKKPSVKDLAISAFSAELSPTASLPAQSAPRNIIPASPQTHSLAEKVEKKQTSTFESTTPKIATAANDDDDEGWSNWGSPPSKEFASASSNTALSTPRSSLSSSDAAKDKRRSVNLDQIPWPALQRLSPSHLTRTASHLMLEWEKSLGDPLEEQEREL